MQNQVPNNWQKVKLEKLININPKQIGTNYPYDEIEYIDIASVGTGVLDTTTHYKLTKAPGRAKRLLNDGDTIISTVRPNRRSFLFIRQPKPNLIASTGFAVLSPKQNILYPKFLYYLVTRQSFTDYLSSNVKGSAYPAISTEVIGNAEIEVPNYSEQKRISSILSSFDDKIELNNKIAKILENMASGIFNDWFVKFHFPGWEKKEFVDSELGKIPQGWEVIKLEKILKLKHGYAFKGNKFINEKTNNIVVRMGNFQENSGLQFLNNTVYLKNIGSQNKYLLNPGDIVMILSDITREGRLIGNVGIIPNDEKNYFLNQRVAKIETDKKYILYLLNLFTSKEFHQHCLSRADSATVLNLKNEHIHDFEIALPEDNIFKKFGELVEPIMNKKEHIKYENQKLSFMRDLLLPKLMKGEIRV